MPESNLILVGASAAIRQEVQRRTSGGCRDSNELTHSELLGAGAVAWLRGPIDWPALQACVAAGKPCLVCSSAIGSLQEFEQLRELDQRVDEVVELGNATQMLPSRVQIVNALSSGRLGDVGMVRIHRWEPARPSQHADLMSYAGWMSDLHLTLQLAARPVVRAYATRGSRGWISHLGFAGGGMAILDLVTEAAEASSYHSLSVIGSQGSASADDHYNVQLLHRGGSVEALRVPETLEASSLMVVDFWSRVHKERQRAIPHAATLAAWRRTYQVAGQLADALRSGTAINSDGRIVA